MSERDAALAKETVCLKSVVDGDDPSDDTGSGAATDSSSSSRKITCTSTDSAKKPRLSKKAMKRMARARRKSEAKQRWVSFMPQTNYFFVLFVVCRSPPTVTHPCLEIFKASMTCNLVCCVS